MADLMKTLRGLFSPTGAEPPSTGLIGANLPSVQGTHELFVFFDFAPTGKEALSEQRVATAFMPTGEAFRELVTLYVTTDAAGTIQVLRLAVARDFIDSPATCIYAADLAKRFLDSVNPQSAEDGIAQLAHEIRAHAAERSSLPPTDSGPLPMVEGEPSAACRTYLGDGPAQTLFNPFYTVQLLLQNDLRAQPPILEMILSARARRTS